ncbi:MAG: methyltransferase domain-containing protein [Thermoplasmata archaeon]|nr:methyltransferase domain-containing protein [Thermoplasmata archaeon]
MGEPLPVLSDRSCSPRALNNPLRRWLAPPSREIELIALSEGDRVADLGAGVGYYVAEILRRIGPAGRLILVEPDGENLAIATRGVRAADPLLPILASATDVSAVGDASVDRVLLSLVLCCLVDKEGAMDEAWRILTPGGLALITYPRLGPILRRRRASLRVTPDRWARLLDRRPWKVQATRRGRVVRRHLLQKPL